MQTKVLLFIDDDTQPIGEFPTPVSFNLDTTKLIDGQHTLKVVSKDIFGKEGIRTIPFIVRNGPAIAIEGLSPKEHIQGTVPLMINAYSKGDQKTFLLHGSESPHSIPWWVITALILFLAWTAYYFISSQAVEL